VVDQLISNLPQEKEQPSSVNSFVFRRCIVPDNHGAGLFR